MWGAVSIRPDRSMAQFINTSSEDVARDLNARVLAKVRTHLGSGVARIEFVTHAPPPMPAWREESTPAPRSTEPLPNPFTAFLRSLKVDHPYVSSTRDLGAIFDAQAKRDVPRGSDHAAFGEGPAFWGYIYLSSARRLEEFIATSSEDEARDLATRALAGFVPGLSRYSYPSVGVARIEFATQAPPIAEPYKPLQNPFTELLRTQAVRPISPDLLPSVRELETIFDTQEEARRGVGDAS